MNIQEADIFDAAMEAAVYEYTEGRKVMLLAPDQTWVCASRLNGVWVRASTVTSALKSLALDTLILVCPSLPTWHKKGEMYARQRLQTSHSPRIIVFDKP